MAAPIKITVRGTDANGHDAPTVEDLLGQIEDFVQILLGLERAMAQDGQGQIAWRFTNITKNSPLVFEITPFPRQHAMNIDDRVKQVVSYASAGFNMLAQTGERPAYFSEAMIGKAEKIYARVTNGLAETTIDFGDAQAVPPITISPQNAVAFADHRAKLRMPLPGPYRELGSVEGFVVKVEKDGYGRPIIWLRTRLDQQTVKCVADGDALSRIGHLAIEDVWAGVRIRVFGELTYKTLGQLEKIKADAVQFFESDQALPSIEAIVDPHFARGVESVAYLRWLPAR
jgi:hypothetical protein